MSDNPDPLVEKSRVRGPGTKVDAGQSGGKVTGDNPDPLVANWRVGESWAEVKPAVRKAGGREGSIGADRWEGR